MTKRAVFITNPLRIAVDGTKLLFQKAPMTAIVLAILSAFSAGNELSRPTPSGIGSAPTTPEMPMETGVLIILFVLIVIVAFGAFILGSLITGIFAHASAQIAKGHEVTFRQSLTAISERLWSYVWLQLLTAVKVILWSLLFIIPGIIMAVRYSLANLSFFDDDKKLTGNAAIKDSLTLTKGAWLTTFASQTFFNIITLGMISPIIDTGAKAILYRQFNELQKTNTPKPKPHILSWITLSLFILIALAAISLIGYSIVNFGWSFMDMR